MTPSPTALTSNVSPVQHMPPSPPGIGPATSSNCHAISPLLDRHAGYVDAHLEHLRKGRHIERLPVIVTPGEVGAMMSRDLDPADEGAVRLEDVDSAGAGRVDRAFDVDLDPIADAGLGTGELVEYAARAERAVGAHIVDADEADAR